MKREKYVLKDVISVVDINQLSKDRYRKGYKDGIRGIILGGVFVYLILRAKDKNKNKERC